MAALSARRSRCRHRILPLSVQAAALRPQVWQVHRRPQPPAIGVALAAACDAARRRRRAGGTGPPPAPARSGWLAPAPLYPATAGAAPQRAAGTPLGKVAWRGPDPPRTCWSLHAVIVEWCSLHIGCERCCQPATRRPAHGGQCSRLVLPCLGRPRIHGSDHTNDRACAAGQGLRTQGHWLGGALLLRPTGAKLEVPKRKNAGYMKRTCHAR